MQFQAVNIKLSTYQRECLVSFELYVQSDALDYYHYNFFNTIK